MKVVRFHLARKGSFQRHRRLPSSIVVLGVPACLSRHGTLAGPDFARPAFSHFPGRRMTYPVARTTAHDTLRGVESPARLMDFPAGAADRNHNPPRWGNESRLRVLGTKSRVRFSYAPAAGLSRRAIDNFIRCHSGRLQLYSH